MCPSAPHERFSQPPLLPPSPDSITCLCNSASQLTNLPLSLIFSFSLYQSLFVSSRLFLIFSLSTLSLNSLTHRVLDRCFLSFPWKPASQQERLTVQLRVCVGMCEMIFEAAEWKLKIKRWMNINSRVRKQSKSIYIHTSEDVGFSKTHTLWSHSSV